MAAFNRIISDNENKNGSRLCGNPECRQPGHNITKCDHISVRILTDKTKRISNYSIAYQYPEFIKKWLLTLSIISLKLLGLSSKDTPHEISSRDTQMGMVNKLYFTWYVEKFINANTPESRLNVRNIARRTFTSASDVSRLTSFMNSIGVPTRPTPVQQIDSRLSTARLNLRLSNTRMDVIQERINSAEQRMIQASQDIRIAEQELRLATTEHEPLITSVFTIQDELDEYRRTHNEGGQLIQRKFQINTFVIEDEELEEGEVVVIEDCPICYDPLLEENTVTINCGHDLCNTCIRRCLDTLPRNQSPTCVLCRAGVESMTFKNENQMKLLTTKYCVVIGEPVQGQGLP
jgi:hypothetical protein